MRRASDTFTVRFFFRFGSMSWSISVKFSIPSGAPCGTHHVEHRSLLRHLDLDLARLELAVDAAAA